MDILITPGTFNSPAPLAVVHGVLDFPKTPFQQVKRPAMQYQSRWVGEEEEEPPVLLANVSKSSRDFFTGAIRVTTSDYNSVATEFTALGVRYVPDGTYAITRRSSFTSEFYASSPAQFAAAAGVGSLNFGGVSVNRGYSSSLHFVADLKLHYSAGLVGCTDGAAYTVELIDVRGSGNFGNSGEVWITAAVSFVGAGPDAFSYEYTGEGSFTLILRRDGIEIDRIFVNVPITGTIGVSAVVAGVTPDSMPVSLGISGSFTDLLYGPDAVPAGNLPGIPFLRYSRFSTLETGRITLL